MENVIEALKAALGAEAVLTGSQIGERYMTNQRGESFPSPRALTRPRSVYFGHVADSNLHASVHLPSAVAARFPKREIENTIYGLVRERQGSISAEHGIGMRKKPFLAYSRTPEEIQIMRSIKQALDPKGILNPGKVLPDPITVA